MSFLFFPWPAAGQLEQALSKCPERGLVQFTLHVAARARVCACGLCAAQSTGAASARGPAAGRDLPPGWLSCGLFLKLQPPECPFPCSVPAPPWPTLSLWPGKPALLSSYSSFTTYSDAPPSGAFCSGPTDPTDALSVPHRDHYGVDLCIRLI